ncbi:MAG: MBL fold metallo-hydrolase, partial [Eubacterium sp.]|nr:MBL fold metallo-hydrolase [Candidatus Colimonas fimequi]
GDCVHIKTEDNKNYLMDGGGSENYQVGKKTLRPYLLKNGVSHIDGAMVTHLHTDHYQGIIELCKEGMVDKLIVYEGNQMFEDEILADTGLKREDVIYVGGGDKLNLGKGARADILWPEKKSVSEYKRSITSETDENEISLIIKVTVNDVDVLVTGDVDAECEEMMINAKGESASASVLKVAHHGSRYSWSDSFMDAVKPEMAVIQVGKNNYGHPTSEVLDGLEARGIPVMRNDLMGAIGLDVRKGQIIGQVHMIENR